MVSVRSAVSYRRYRLPLNRRAPRILLDLVRELHVYGAVAPQPDATPLAISAPDDVVIAAEPASG